MKPQPFFSLFSSALAVFCLIVFAFQALGAEEKSQMTDPIQAAEKLKNEGLWKEVVDLLRPWVLDEKSAAAEVDEKSVSKAIDGTAWCLMRLNRTEEVDEFLEKAVEIHRKNWRAVNEVANQLQNRVPHLGMLIDDKFVRKNNAEQGKIADSESRDRVRALQLYVEALPLALEAVKKNPAEATDVAEMFAWLSSCWGSGGQAWKLQSLTDFSTLPDYETFEQRYRDWSREYAPVDENGDPVLYSAPESFESAENDGERMRWCLEQAAKVDPSQKGRFLLRRAGGLKTLYGEETLSGFEYFRTQPADPERQSAIWNLETLSDDEMIARLATGIKRFKLPDEFNHIAIFKHVAEIGTESEKIYALEQLATIAMNRRQFEKAVGYWQRLLEEFPTPKETGKTAEWQRQLDQIVGNWGRFESTGSKVVGVDAVLRYTYRNGKKVKLLAREIKIPTLIADIKDYLKSQPKQLDWNRIQIDQIGWQLLHQRGGDVKSPQEKYLGDEVAAWTVDLTPAEKHFDRQTTISVPIEKTGAYLVKAEMEAGNTEYIVLWLNDTAIAKKQLDKASLYFVADAATGEPVESADLDFFGYRMEWPVVERSNNRTRTATEPVWSFKEFVQKTDADGLSILEQDENLNNFNWLVTTKSGDGRFAYLGFDNIWFSQRYDERYHEVKTFFISDRPVYRPGDTVEMKVWVGTTQYDKSHENEWSGRTIQYEIHDPKGEKIAEKGEIKLDAYGGFVSELKLSKDATLGVYSFHLTGPVYGSGTFRVEEYRKPEYEVTVEAPKEPVRLGEKIKAKISARYYFGSPVTEATVKYKVLREKHNAEWFPVRPWDWFYGGGYAWFSYDTPWLSGWNRWGVCRPAPFWFPRSSGPPEVVSEREVKISDEGTVDIEIDTSLAAAMFPDDNQKYSITAEVVDNSRRTITGSGNVLVSKEPFKVYAWVDRGWYEPNQKIEVGFQARRLDGKPVSGDAAIKLYKITYKEPNSQRSGASGFASQETEVHSENVKFDAEGRATLSLTAAEPGQYRISCKIDGQEGGYVFNVYDNEPRPMVAEWKFNVLELIPDKAEYASGENVALNVNTDRENAFVLLFVKPSNGVALKPQVLRLAGKSTQIEIPVELRDMPNFFVEALTISNGKVVNETREIVVPPQQKVLNVEVKPNAETYKPGAPAQCELIVTDLAGTPVPGQIVVAIYDKSVEYISGGSNVADIKEFFWKWRRHHYPQTQSSLEKHFPNMPEPGKPGMQFLGIFGREQRDEFKFNVGFMRGGGVSLGRRMDTVDSLMLAESAAVPAAAPMAKMRAMEDADRLSANDTITWKEERKQDSGGGEAQMVEPTIRKNFADTALWIGALETDENGKATIELAMPESLTTWKINVWAMGSGVRVGSGFTEVITRKDLIIRMQTPRFLVEKDKVVFSANVHNYLANDKDVKVVIEESGDRSQETGVSCLALLDKAKVEQTVKIPAGGEARVDWQVEASSSGDAVVTMKAITDEESDAMQRTLPVFVHGMLKQESWSGYVSPDKESASVEIKVPEQRRPEQTKLTVRFSPTLAASMIDALPYLVDYPYGCTEQTLNRFLPTVIVQKILVDSRQLSVVSKKTNLNAQELGEGRKPSISRRIEPVFDIDEVRKMVSDGVAKLTNMQCSDGGWGWFGGNGERSSAHLTALVVHGLLLARNNDVAVDENVISNGVTWLRRYQKEQANLVRNYELSETERKGKPFKHFCDEIDAFVLMVLAETKKGNDESSSDSALIANHLWKYRSKLSLYGIAMYSLALHERSIPSMQKDERIPACVKMLEQYLVQDEENQTAWLNLRGGGNWAWWSWHGSEFETQAYYLKLLMRTDPKNPIAPRLVKYLLNNRRHATYWNSTRDTAIVIEAFAEFLKATGEDKPNMTVDVLFDGQVKKTVEITPENFLDIDNTLVLGADEISAGVHKVELRKKGQGPLYFNAYLENFTLEDPIAKTGLEVQIERRFYRLDRDESAKTQAAGGRGQVLDLKTEKYNRVPIESFQSGDLVEVELIVESKNDYESILIEDKKAAGLEPVDVRSGYTDNELGAYVEFRDDRVAMFVYRLMQGKRSVTYRLRAEQPGDFSALPATIYGMYAPELKGNSDENKIHVTDR